MRREQLWIKLGAFVAVLGGLSVPLVARSLDPLPHAFAAGDTVSARDINENFDHLREGIEAIEQGAPGGLCGSTAETSGRITAPGGLIGFPAMAALCADACSSPTAHACTGDEVLRTAQLGVVIGDGWFTTTSQYSCLGWTDGVGGAGTAWHPDTAAEPGSYPTIVGCSVPQPILCCD